MSNVIVVLVLIFAILVLLSVWCITQECTIDNLNDRIKELEHIERAESYPDPDQPEV